MRAFALMLLAGAWPTMASAQPTEFVLGIRFEKDGALFVFQTEGGFTEWNEDKETVTKWYDPEPKAGPKINKKMAAHAVADLTEQIRNTPTGGACNDHLAMLYKLRGIASRFQAEYANAIADFTESLRLNPRQADIYTQRGYAQFKNGDFDSAIKDYDRAWRLAPESAWNLFHRGEARLEKSFKQWKIKKDETDIKGALVAAETNLNAARGKATNAQKDVKDSENRMASYQTEVDKATAAFTQADQDLAQAKDAWNHANKDLSQANKEYLPYAARTFNRVDFDLLKAQFTWTKARENVTAKYAALAAENVTKTKADSKKTDADKDAADKQQPFDVANADLSQALADFTRSLRLEPAASATIRGEIKPARKLLEQVQRILKKP